MSMFVFFVKQKTAYELRISDWSSDVCSSDLLMGSWMPLMKEDGCMAIHLGSAVYYRGMPAISSYRERFVVAAQDELGLYRMPDLYWEQPARLPNLEWGAVRGHHPRQIGRAHV